MDIVTIDVDCRLTDKQVLDTPREPNMNLNGYTSIGRDIDGKKIRVSCTEDRLYNDIVCYKGIFL